MPDPNKWFTQKIHNYYKKCQEIYVKDKNIGEINNYIYRMGPFTNFYDISNKTSKLYNIIKDIFDNCPNAKQMKL